MPIDDYADIYNETFGGLPSNFVAKPGTYRVVNENNPGGSIDPHHGYHSKDSLRDYLSESGNKSLEGMFHRVQDAPIFQNISLSIPINYILTVMEDLAQPIYCGFIETNYEENFLDISSKLYYELFGIEEIYVGYNFFTNEDKYYTDKGTKMPEEIDYYRKNGGLDTFVKCTGKYDDRDIQFMHLNTNFICYVPNWQNKLIRVTGSGKRHNNFIKGFQYAIEGILGYKKCANMENLVIKRVSIHGEQNPQKYASQMDSKLEGIQMTLVSDEHNRIHVVPKVFAQGSELKDLTTATFSRLDRRAYELGRVSNTNPKGERLSTGENYKDITSVAARQKDTLCQLKNMANKIKKMWGLELNFAVNGIPEKEKIPTESTLAPNPNSEENDSASMGSGFGR